MRGVIPPLPNTPSRRGARLKKQHRDNFTLHFFNTVREAFWPQEYISWTKIVVTASPLVFINTVFNLLKHRFTFLTKALVSSPRPFISALLCILEVEFILREFLSPPVFTDSLTPFPPSSFYVSALCLFFFGSMLGDMYNIPTRGTQRTVAYISRNCQAHRLWHMEIRCGHISDTPVVLYNFLGFCNSA
jgi:hypothetical protein